MEQYKEVLDKLSSETKHLYILQLINIDNHNTTSFSNLNSMCVIVEDCDKFNGTYDSLEQLNKTVSSKKSYYKAKDGEIYENLMDGFTIGHYKYI